MNRTDGLIAQALSAEDRELLARHAEPGYFRQALGLFRGSLGWVVWVSYLTGIAAFVGVVLALWQTWHATDAIGAVRWGVLGVILFQYSAMIKGFLGTHFEANRTLREIKRVELQVALLAAGAPPSRD
jgi:hypothetical protein